MRKKVVYIVSNIEKALAFEWLADTLANTYELSFIFLNPKVGGTETEIKKKRITCYHIPYDGKKDIVPAFLKVLNLLKRIKPVIIHTHLFDASLIGLTAGRIIGVKKRIYTRHHATLHHQFFRRAVFYDRIINSLATHIVAISLSIKHILTRMEDVEPLKLIHIPHGFDLASFRDVKKDRLQTIRERYHIDENSGPIIGVISRYTEWKGIQYIIPAFKSLLNVYPDAILILANAGGDYVTNIRKELVSLPAKNYREISFEADIAALYQIFDVYVHVPVDPLCEAFGQTYVEALAAKVPSVFTLSGVATEFIKHEENALVVPFKNSQAIEKAALTLLSSPQLCERLKENGRNDVEAKFNLTVMVQRIKKLYDTSE